MDLGALDSLFAILFDGSLVQNDESSNVILLVGQVEELADSGGSLGTSSSGSLLVGESYEIRMEFVSGTFDLGFTLLDDGKSEGSDIGADDAASDRLLLSFTSSSGSVSGVSLRHKESGSALDEDTLLHGEAVLIISTSDFKDIALPVVSENGSVDFLSHLLSVEGKPWRLWNIAIIYNFLSSSTTRGRFCPVIGLDMLN